MAEGTPEETLSPVAEAALEIVANLIVWKHASDDKDLRMNRDGHWEGRVGDVSYEISPPWYPDEVDHPKMRRMWRVYIERRSKVSSAHV